MRLGSQSVDILDPAVIQDDYHNEVEDWSNPVPTTIDGCSVQPGVGGKYYDDRAAVTTLWTVWAPLSTVVTPRNRVRYDGTVYAIDGQVESWPASHVVIRLKAVDG